MGLDPSLLLDQTEARRVKKNHFLTKNTSHFHDKTGNSGWKIKWETLEKVFAGNLRKYGLWFKAMQFLLYRFNLPLLTDLYAL